MLDICKFEGLNIDNNLSKIHFKYTYFVVYPRRERKYLGFDMVYVLMNCIFKF